jgi:predicted GNAT family acetyltransferase
MPGTLLTRIEDHVRTVAAMTNDSVYVGPFVGLLHPTDAGPWFNYAMPIDRRASAEELLAATGQLQSQFAARQRMVRFEYTVELWPHLLDVLHTAGAYQETVCPQMLCIPATFQPGANPAVMVRLLQPDDDLGGYRSLSDEIFGMSQSAPNPADDDRMRLAMSQGWRYAIAELDGQLVGTGSYIPVNGLAELVAITTHPVARRIGVATTLASFLVADHFRRGGEMAFLFAANAAAYEVYKAVGFKDAGTHLTLAIDS